MGHLLGHEDPPTRIGVSTQAARDLMDTLLNLLQWPAMAITLLATWFVASTEKGRREAGFWFFMVGNVLWAAWGWHDGAFALIALQIGLLALNIRGARKAETSGAA